ncbi:exopolysaccharide biosynthesis protein [Roseibium sp. AS2]|uniref:exopolysaccharide biosynthesis protein n=1 Tax=Roseibium sp. AS2 TaxID=3135781 RepID=UPI003175C383
MTRTSQESVALTDLIDRTVDVAWRDTLRLGRVVDTFEQTGFAALIMIPAAAVVTPLSGIPLFSSLCGLTIALFSVQWLIGRDQVWLPQWLGRRSLAGSKVREAMTRLRPAAAWLDDHSHTRVRFLFHRPFRFLLPLSCALFGAFMPLLELVPFSSSLLGGAVCLIAFSRMTRDGLYALIAILPVGAAVWAVYALVLSG